MIQPSIYILFKYTYICKNTVESFSFVGANVRSYVNFPGLLGLNFVDSVIKAILMNTTQMLACGNINSWARVIHVSPEHWSSQTVMIPQ